MKELRIDIVPPETRTEHLLKTRQERYHYTDLLGREYY
jgi:hypothetical protein